MEVFWVVAMLYNRRLMHNEDAVIPTPAPSRSFVAVGARLTNCMEIEYWKKNLQISHQTGALSSTFPDQMRLLMNSTKHDNDAQIIKAHVPEFQAWRCHGKGIRATTKPRKDRTGKRGYVGSWDLCILKCGCVRREKKEFAETRKRRVERARNFCHHRIWDWPQTKEQRNFGIVNKRSLHCATPTWNPFKRTKSLECDHCVTVYVWWENIYL